MAKEETDGAQRFDAIEVTPQGGRPVELWFDRQSHLPIDRRMFAPTAPR